MHFTFKKMFSDFIVTELDASGAPVELRKDQTTLPSKPEWVIELERAEAAAAVEAPAPGEDEEDILIKGAPRSIFAAFPRQVQLATLLGQASNDAVTAAQAAGGADDVSIPFDASSITKDEKKLLHQLFSTELPSFHIQSKNGEMTIQRNRPYQMFESILDAIQLQKLMAFSGDQSNRGRELQFEAPASKSNRSAFYGGLKKHLGFLEAKTHSPGSGDQHSGSQLITVRFRGGLDGKKSKKRKRSETEQAGVSSQTTFYTRFVLQKANVESFDAISRLAKATRSPTSSFGHAGTKDKFALTLQLISVQGVSPEVVREAGKHLLHRDGIEIGNLSYSKTPLSPGDAQGNRFRLRLRELEGPTSRLKERVERIAEGGFINFYGPQRFGDPEEGCLSHEVGLAMLQGEYEAAVNLLLGERKSDDERVVSAKRLYREERDYAAAALAMPKHKAKEKQVLQSLRDYFRDHPSEGLAGAGHGERGFVEALKKGLPHFQRSFYAHSVSSLVWNKLASYRATLGHTVLAGDLVERATRAPDGTATVSGREGEDGGYHVVAEGEEGGFGVEQVMVPMCGSGVRVPPLLQAEYDAALHELGLESSHFATNCKALGFTVPGAQRHWLVVPKDVKVEVSEATEDGCTTPGATAWVEFSLKPGAFATAMLRELRGGGGAGDIHLGA